MNTPKNCPMCGTQLVKGKLGVVCKNWRCKLYWKVEGWTFIKKQELWKKN